MTDEPKWLYDSSVFKVGDSCYGVELHKDGSYKLWSFKSGKEIEDIALLRKLVALVLEKEKKAYLS
jgi:hypothetical protein